jgi:phosphate transport system substrate-binding protein
MQSSKALVIGLTALIGVSFAQAQAARDYISIVGSSTVYPFATVVAEQFGRSTRFKTPKIESTGTGGGFKLFCAGIGVQHPDITNASRAIKKSEFEQCMSNGVTEVVEIKIGYDGITVAHAASSKPVALTRRELWMALAKEVPDPKGERRLVANPYRNWNEINPTLPAIKIEVLGPPPTSGTRDAFVELVMDEGCSGLPLLRDLKVSSASQYKAVCQTMREDGGYVEAGENDNLIVQKLVANPSAFGIFGYSFLDQNRDRIRGVSIEGVKPEFESIANGKYVVSRPLFIYVKKAHAGVVPGVKEYIAEFTADKAWGSEGYLASRGLIPLPDAERKQYGQAAMALTPLASPK